MGNNNPSDSSGSLAVQFLWAFLVVLATLWVMAFAVHLRGGLITYLLILSLAALLIRTAAGRARASNARAVSKESGRE